MQDKFSSQQSEMKDVEDRFGEDSWGVKKFVNAKKTESGPSKMAPVIKQEGSQPESQQDSKPKPKQFLDRNNMFSILPTN